MRRIHTILLALLAISSLFIAASGTALADERAEIAVSQPEYVDAEVQTDRAENATVYHVQGPEQTLRLESANYSNVTDAGVLDGPGTIEPDDGDRAFTFDPQGKEATTRIFFDVREGNQTTRYIADIRASNVQWAHMPQSEYEKDQEPCRRGSRSNATRRTPSPDRTP